jgi:hypothetical protein
LLRLPALIERIEQLDETADTMWEKMFGGGDALADILAGLSESYDAVRLHPRVYERLVRQSDKPIIAQAMQARDLATYDPRRLDVERILRLPVDDYLRLEEGIQIALTRIDSDRDAIALAHREMTDAYVRAAGYGDGVSLAAGRLGTRLAVNRFDDHQGYAFMDYGAPWIDRELQRAGAEKQA